jgi:hypothetical protein
VITRDRIRELAVALPQTTERDHHGQPSFRVADEIFATLWDEGHMSVMLDEPGSAGTADRRLNRVPAA